MVNPDQRRAAADYLNGRYGVSERRVCRVMGRSRSVLRYRRSRVDERALSKQIKRLARRHFVTVTAESMPCWSGGGWLVNLKRMKRLRNALGLRRPLSLRKPRNLSPKPATSAYSCVQQPARFKNDAWTSDFNHDRRAGGRPLKCLTLVDE